MGYCWDLLKDDGVFWVPLYQQFKPIGRLSEHLMQAKSLPYPKMQGTWAAQHSVHLVSPWYELLSSYSVVLYLLKSGSQEVNWCAYLQSHPKLYSLTLWFPWLHVLTQIQRNPIVVLIRSWCRVQRRASICWGYHFWGIPECILAARRLSWLAPWQWLLGLNPVSYWWQTPSGRLDQP